jgi:apolipoprotein N-acyltransferase
MMSVFTSLTYIIDRIYTQKVKGIISTLVFPSVYVIMEYIVISTNPSGSYGTLAHTQISLPLIQVISITGIWGLIFLITWTASIINWLWDNSFEESKLKQSLLFYGVPLLFIIISGQIRIQKEIQASTVRVASINIEKAHLKYHMSKNADSIEARNSSNFLRKCDVAASAGSKIVFGAEAIVTISEDAEEGFIEKAKITALKNNVYFGIPMCIIPKGYPQKKPENKIVWISPKGEIIFTYHKSRPTPGEGNYGDGIIKYFDSPYGRVGSAICFDMDFPDLINQVRNMNIDIMLVPANDWEEIAPYHTYVASFRAIEHGFNMVRSASKGLSAAFNYKGQVLASQDFFTSDSDILYSDVPVEGHKTVYSIIGDLLAWLCILFFVVISVVLIKGK